MKILKWRDQGAACCRFDTTGKTAKPAACFARRVKGVAQKYSAFRKPGFMI
jgi:hypothetical protein